ncbi:MAG TPA: phosphoadenylyl-sulfate reductase [Thermoanaerobaculia bacterium]|nr:phosphoadenylyl-sulfate reductase [Thermoanaerobaculia bacterium]
MRTDADALDARELLAWALEAFHPKLALACSFQKEEAVLLDLLFELEPDARVFALDTGVLFPETYEVWRAAEERYGTVIEAWRGEWVEGLRASDPAHCCHLRKVEPLGRALAPLDAWITGLRREQWASRANIRKVEIDHEHGGLAKINPLADWTIEEVWDYIRHWDVPVHPLYEKGFTSIGCAPCTRATAEGEDARAGRWWWETNAPKECGIHCPLETGGFEHEIEAILHRGALHAVGDRK